LNYTLIDHTADFGIHVLGQDKNQLFQNAALAMFELIVETENPQESVQERVSISGDDWPDLMVNWLRELLYLWTGKEKILQSIAVDTLIPYTISARVTVESYTPDQHSILNEIKAVTYHQIDVFEKDNHWEARIIFDV